MSSNQVSPRVSNNQTGSVNSKRAAEVSADVDANSRAKRPRGPESLDNIAGDNEVETIVAVDDFSSPNSRWEASEELSTFLGSIHKRISKFERKTLVRSHPRPDVDAVYTSSMDDYLKPFIQGIMTPDKPLKELQDNILDLVGPLSTMFENFLAMRDNLDQDGVIELDKASINSFLSCVKYPLLLAGDALAGISIKRRELVLKKINPLLVSMANEHFPYAQRQLFGPGIEQRLKTRSETASTIEKASRVTTAGRGKPFFRGGASRGGQIPRGGHQLSQTISFRPFLSRGRGWRGRGFQRQAQFPRFSNPQKFRTSNHQ